VAFYGKMQEFGVVGQFCLFCESCNGHKKYTVLVMAELVGMYLTIISLVNISIKGDSNAVSCSSIAIDITDTFTQK